MNDPAKPAPKTVAIYCRKSSEEGLDREFNSLDAQRESAEAFVVVESATQERRVAVSDVKEITPGSVSIMPQGMDEQLGAEAMADLVAFMRSLR
mgnify:CR=1 FL=1